MTRMRMKRWVLLTILLQLTQVSCLKAFTSSVTAPSDGGGSGDAPSVVARWSFENDWLDAVGSNHGTIVPGTSPAFTTDKLLGTYAADLSSADARVDLGTSASLTPTNLTVSFWLKRTAPSSGTNVLLWTKPCQWDHADGYYIAREGTGKAITLIVSGANLLGVNGDPDVVFALNTWSHVAVTFDSGTHVGHIYINGVDQPLISYGTPQVISPATGTAKYIGSCGAGSAIAWPLDELTVINGVLSATEIQALYLDQKTAAGI